MVFKTSAHFLFLARERYMVKFFFIMIINFLLIFKGFNFRLLKIIFPKPGGQNQMWLFGGSGSGYI